MIYVFAADITEFQNLKEFPELLKGLPEDRKQILWEMWNTYAFNK